LKELKSMVIEPLKEAAEDDEDANSSSSSLPKGVLQDRSV
jgi:hypothetical protein